MIQLLLTYKYLILFPLSVVEGPIVTVVAGFMSRTGVFNIYLVYITVVFGDIFGDALAYCIGRFGGPVVIGRFSRIFKISPEKMEQVQEYFRLNHYKTLILSKVVHGVGVAGLLTAGHLKIPYGKFLLSCLIVSLVQSAVFIVLGIFFGQLYLQIGKYFTYYAIGISAAAVIGIFVYINRKKIFKKGQ